MQTLFIEVPQLFIADARALVNGLARLAAHPWIAALERIASACDVAGLLAARRERRPSANKLFRAARCRGGRRHRRSLFGCFRHLSELT